MNLKIHSIFRSVLLILLWPLFFSAYAQEEEGQIPDSVEIHALTQLYASTNGEEWDDNTNWLKVNKWPDWEGVTYENGDVVGLNLRSNDLHGSLPEVIYELTALQVLNLSRNKLSGKIAPAIGHLANLEVLSLARNELTGRLPREIGLLVRIQELDLSANNLDGQLPDELYDLVSLKALFIGRNSFDGELSEEVGKLVNLEVLNIGDNLFEGTLPSSMGNLTKLYELSLEYCLFRGELPDSFRHLTSLEILSIHQNQFSGTIPQYFVDFPLRNFWIDYNQFQGIPDFSSHANPGSIRFVGRGNQLDFGDLEPNWTEDGSIFSTSRYDPQDSVATFFSSSDRTYSVEVGGQYNRYQWYKSETAIPGAVGPTYTASLNDDLATYQCRITNTLIDDLTLWSESKVTRAGQYYAIADGDWDELIWSREKDGPVTDTTPGEGSEVFIIGKNVTLRQSLTTGPVHVVIDETGASLTVDRAELTVVGSFDLTKEMEGYPGGVKVINGGRIRPVHP
ncbi:MAG: hypothetical protein AAGA66_04280 [Bacteroidota bacterium]